MEYTQNYFSAFLVDVQWSEEQLNRRMVESRLIFNVREMEILREQPKSHSDESFKLAIAMALVRSKLLHKPPAATPVPPSSCPPLSHSDDAVKWKQKAKERKREILRLKEDLKVAEG